MELQGKKIAFLGDSITEGWGTTHHEKMYVEILKKNCMLKEAYNYGIGGTRISKQKKPSKDQSQDQDFISRVQDMEKSVDAVVVFGGTNDFGHGDAPIGCLGDTAPDTFYGACYTLMRTLIDRYPDIPIVFLTPLHRVGENTTVNEIGLERVTLRKYAEAICEVAKSFSLPVLDLFSVSGMQPEVSRQNELYFTDGLHLNDKGHEKLAKMLEAFMKNLVC